MPAVPARLQQRSETLSPRLRRAARWIADHPDDVCFLSRVSPALRKALERPTESPDSAAYE